jgi:hypothetical protein
VDSGSQRSVESNGLPRFSRFWSPVSLSYRWRKSLIRLLVDAERSRRDEWLFRYS